MKKLFLIIISITLIACNALSDWVIMSGDQVKTTPNDNFLIAGRKCDGEKHLYNGFLVKINKKGELQWSKEFKRNNNLIINFFIKNKQIDVFLIIESKLMLISMNNDGKILQKKWLNIIPQRPDCIIQENNDYIICDSEKVLKINSNGDILKEIHIPIKSFYYAIAKMNNKYLLYGYNVFINDKNYDFVNINKYLKLYFITEDIDILIADDKEKCKINFLYSMSNKKIVLSLNNEILTLNNSMEIVSIEKTKKHFDRMILHKDNKILIQSNDVVNFNNEISAYKSDDLIWEMNLKDDKYIILDGEILDNNIFFVGYKAIKKIDTVYRYGHKTNLYIANYDKSGNLLWDKTLSPQFLKNN